MRRLKPSVQIHGSDYRFHNVRGNGIPSSASGGFFSLTQQHILPQLQITGAVRQRRFTDHGRTQLRQLAFRHLGVLMEQEITGYQLQHRIPQKFQPFIIFQFVYLLLIGKGTVGQSLPQQLFVTEGVPDPFFKLFQCIFHTYPVLSAYQKALQVSLPRAFLIRLLDSSATVSMP